MGEKMTQSILGVYFTVVVREKCSLDQLALDVTKSMGCFLSQSIERGIVGDYVGEFLGMRLNLYISQSEDAINDEGVLFVFGGAPEFEGGINISWTDISSYVAQVLQERTGLPWSNSQRSSL
jgi:hypothetical protein